jgi:5-formyltetrahydrofolate cyclo-ligase
VLHPFSPGNLLFLHYHPHSELVVNRLKIPNRNSTCATCCRCQLDVLITPLVAFDEQGQRWDGRRFLRQNAAKLAAVSVAAGGLRA